MTDLILNNLTSPPLLFFFLGALAVWVRSDLDIPGQIARFLSLYLLFAIGFKGGVALAEAPLDQTVWLTLAAAVLLSAVVPVYVFLFLRSRFGTANAAAIAATYGSVSAVTFITATSYLTAQNVAWGGHLVAAMALMESPAIIVGMALYSFHAQRNNDSSSLRWGKLLHEACLNGSVFLIVGSMLIGWISGPKGMDQLNPVIQAPFIGVLCLFLLDMGIVAARRLKDLGDQDSDHKLPLISMILASLLFPLLNGALAMGLGLMLDLSEGDLVLLTVLGASASYIAVPAALRLALPQASPSIYLPMSLAITFPFNIVLGIPLFHLVAQRLM